MYNNERVSEESRGNNFVGLGGNATIPTSTINLTMLLHLVLRLWQLSRCPSSLFLILSLLCYALLCPHPPSLLLFFSFFFIPYDSCHPFSSLCLESICMPMWHYSCWYKKWHCWSSQQRLLCFNWFFQ